MGSEAFLYNPLVVSIEFVDGSVFSLFLFVQPLFDVFLLLKKDHKAQTYFSKGVSSLLVIPATT